MVVTLVRHGAFSLLQSTVEFPLIFNLSIVVRVLNVLVFAESAKSKTELLIHLTCEYFTEKYSFLHFAAILLTVDCG